MKNVRMYVLALEKALAADDRRAKRKADWTDNNDKRVYIARYKREQREVHIPTSRRCPVCKKVFVKSRSWVVKGEKATCRKCWAKRN